MNRLFCPNTLEGDPDSTNAVIHWNHGQHRLQNFIRSTSANFLLSHKSLTSM